MVNRTAHSDAHSARFDQLIDELLPAFVRQATAMVGDRSAADDVTQKAFLSLWNSRRRLPDAPAELRRYAFRTLINSAREWHRRTDRQRRRDAAVARPADASAPDAALQQSVAREMWDLVEQLPAPQRDVLVLRFGLGRSLQEAAVELGLPEGTVSSRQRAGIAALRERYAVTAPASALAALMAVLQTGAASAGAGDGMRQPTPDASSILVLKGLIMASVASKTTSGLVGAVVTLVVLLLLVAVVAGITLSGPPAKAPARNDVVITPLEPLHRANTPARNDTHRANAAVSHTPAANTDPLTPATDEPPPADAAQMLQIVGVVVDGLGRPVPAATIALYDSSSEGSTRSGSDGRFTLLADPADPADQSWLNVKVTCDGYLPRYTNARFAEGKTRSDIGTLRLDRPVHLSGVVRNRAGSPIENAVVRRGPAFSRVGYYLSGPADAPTGTSPASPDDDLGPEGTRTDAQGRFDLAALPPGRISVSADHPAYCPVELPFTFADGETRGPIEIVLDDPMTLDVFVTASDGALLPGVSVMAREADYNPQRMKDVPQWTATTDASGFARIEGLTVEVVELNVSAPPHASFRRKIRLAAGTNRQDVVLSTGGTLVGRVLIGDRPAANRGVMIGAMTAAGEFLQPTDTADVRFRMSTTDDAGRFCEPGLPPGTYGVRVDSAPVSTTDSRMTQAVTTGPLTIDDGEADCGDITVGVFASLIVRVVDADGKPLPGVQVRTMAINAMLTDADGRVELPPVGFLAYPMQVMVTRDDPTTGRSVIGAMGVPSWPLNESREVELRLDPPATLRVRTLDLVGTPVSQLVMLFGETGTRLVSNLWGATTPGDGSAIDVAVYPGTWRLRARGNQRADDSETIVTVGPGETRNVDLMPREPWTCEVEVRRFDGLPAAGRSCRLGSLDFGANGQFTLASYLMPTDVGATDRDGVLRLLVPALRMPDESCTLALEVGGADGEPATVFELSRSDNAAGRLVVTLLPPPSARAGATIRGLLRDADDRPVAGGEVVLLRTPAAGSRLRYRHVVRTGVDGRFAATDLPAGSWTLMPGDVTVDLLDGQTVERDLLAGASR